MAYLELVLTTILFIVTKGLSKYIHIWEHLDRPKHRSNFKQGFYFWKYVYLFWFLFLHFNGDYKS